MQSCILNWKKKSSLPIRFGTKTHKFKSMPIKDLLVNQTVWKYTENGNSPRCKIKKKLKVTNIRGNKHRVNCVLVSDIELSSSLFNTLVVSSFSFIWRSRTIQVAEFNIDQQRQKAPPPPPPIIKTYATVFLCRKQWKKN